MPTKTEIEKTLPAAIEAEKAILGAILLGSSIPADLYAEDFSLDGHRRIYDAIVHIASEGASTDLITVPNLLRERRDLESAGGLTYVMSLTDGVPRNMRLDSYVTILREKAQLRSIVYACESAIAQAMEQLPVSECMASVENALLEIEARRAGSQTYHISEFLPQTIALLKQEAEAQGLVGFTTGVNELDAMTTGVRKGELWLIGGLPNAGKTPLGIQIAMENARRGVPTQIFSLEMSRYQLAARILAESGVVPAAKTRRPKSILPAEWGAMMEEEYKLSKLPLWVNDASRIKLSELMLRSKFIIRTRKVELIIVDYLMLVEASGRDLRQQADSIAQGLKAMAKSEDIAVVLLSQFRRPANINDRPNLTWFKESGGIEATANTALGVHRPVEEDEVTPTGEDEIIILKQREGERGAVPVYFNEKELRFYDRDRRGSTR